MKYAHVMGGVVIEPLFTPPDGFTIADCFHDSLTWIDCTSTPGVAPGWTYAGGVFAAPAAVTPPAPTTITPESFIDRFSAAEQQAVITASQTSWQINLWLTKAVAATTVDVTDARTVSGMAALVTAGVLTADRSAHILNLAVISP